MPRQTNDLAADLLHTLFEYRDGELYWKERGKSRQMGKPVGCVNGEGYRQVKINGKIYAIHRLIWVMHGNEPAPYIDHINGEKLDNRIENLRAATQSQNSMNRCQRSDNKSGIKGVRWIKGKDRWHGCVTLNYKNYSAGYFQNKEEAAIAVAKLREELHGEYAKH